MFIKAPIIAYTFDRGRHKQTGEWGYLNTDGSPQDIFSGRNGLLFRRNSVSGALEALPRAGTWGALNADLHAN